MVGEQPDFPILIAVNRHQITSGRAGNRGVNISAHTLGLVGAIPNVATLGHPKKEPACGSFGSSYDERLGSSSVGSGLDAIQFRVLAALGD
jgi:hypothetical protein